MYINYEACCVCVCACEVIPYKGMQGTLLNSPDIKQLNLSQNFSRMHTNIPHTIVYKMAGA